MYISAFSVAFLVGIGLQGAAIAATIPDISNNAPAIQGQDVHSRFLNGAYTPGQALSDDGFPRFTEASSAGSAIAQTSFESKPAGSSLPLSQTSFEPGSSSPDSFVKTLDTVPTGGDFATQHFDSANTNVFGGGPSLSTVPLPAAAPLFGAALLILGGLGHRLRVRASRQV